MVRLLYPPIRIVWGTDRVNKPNIQGSLYSEKDTGNRNCVHIKLQIFSFMNSIGTENISERHEFFPPWISGEDVQGLHRPEEKELQISREHYEGLK